MAVDFILPDGTTEPSGNDFILGVTPVYTPCVSFMVVSSWGQPEDNYTETGVPSRDREDNAVSKIIANKHRVPHYGYTYQIRFKAGDECKVHGYQVEVMHG